uniref:Integrase catalytic domain-containing protein n=1 Tax=Cannabis sativa TaxID=3483 RepID=A0A803NUC9_CANSA
MSTPQDHSSTAQGATNQGDQTPTGQTPVPVTTMVPTSSSSSTPPISNPFSNTLSQPFSLKLDRNNFPLWKTMVNTIIRGHRLDGFINGSRPTPPEFITTGTPIEGVTGSGMDVNPEYETWLVYDQLLMGWLYGSMTEAIASEVMGCQTALALWNSLEELYGAHSRANMDDLRTKIQKTRKGSQTMADYLKMKRMWADSLASAVICYNRYDETYMGNQPNTAGSQDKQFSALIATPEMLNDDNWYADSGASNHLTSDPGKIQAKTEYEGKEQITIGDGRKLPISHVGSGVIQTKSSNPLLLKNMLHIPSISKNLISVSQLTTDNNVSMEFFSDFCCVKDQSTGKVVLHETLKDGLYQLHTSPQSSQSASPFSAVAAMAETQFGRKVKKLRTDWGGESQAFSTLVAQNGILFDHSCPNTLAQNGRAERKHRHIVEMGLTLLAQAAMPQKYWSDAFQTAVYFINRLPTTILNHKSPYEVIHSKTPDYKFLKSVIITMPSTWIQLPFNTQSSFPSTEPPSHPPSTQDQVCTSIDHGSPISAVPHGSQRVTGTPSSQPEQVVAAQQLPSASVQPHHPMITRGKVGIFKPQILLSTATSQQPLREPSSVQEALLHEGWNNAMGTEMVALRKNKTWYLVPPSPDYHIVGNKWVYKIKYNADGSVQRLKARLVAKGFHQRPGLDFGETFIPVIKASTVRVVLTIAVAYNWDIRQLDINNAFLNGVLDEEVYMTQPQGFEDPTKPHYVCKLEKSIYGLKQAPRAWYERLKDTLQQWNFENSKADTSFFMLKQPDYVIMVLIYVDDIVVTGRKSKELGFFITRLNKIFSLKDLGGLHYFLGIEAFRDETGLYLTQGKYISELLQRVNMSSLKLSPTPMTTNKPLSIHDGEPMTDPSLYRSVIGALQYLSHTRPDISFAVNKLSQFLKSPTNVHWNATKRVLRYLKGTLNHGYCVFMGDTLISWSSKKQTVVARSSTESEYRALAQLAAELAWLQELLKEMKFKLPAAPIIWCDNMSASALAANPVYHARTKHIELDIHFVRDKVLQKQLQIRYAPSHDQITDCLTKGLSHSRFKFLVDKLGVIESPSRLRGGVTG